MAFQLGLENPLVIHDSSEKPSFFQDLKRNIIDESLLVLVNIVIIPHTGWDPTGSTPGSDTVWSNVLRNASGILR